MKFIIKFLVLILIVVTANSVKTTSLLLNKFRARDPLPDCKGKGCCQLDDFKNKLINTGLPAENQKEPNAILKAKQQTYQADKFLRETGTCKPLYQQMADKTVPLLQRLQKMVISIQAELKPDKRANFIKSLTHSENKNDEFNQETWVPSTGYRLLKYLGGRQGHERISLGGVLSPSFNLRNSIGALEKEKKKDQTPYNNLIELATKVAEDIENFCKGFDFSLAKLKNLKSGTSSRRSLSVLASLFSELGSAINDISADKLAKCKQSSMDVKKATHDYDLYLLNPLNYKDAPKPEVHKLKPDSSPQAKMEQLMKMDAEKYKGKVPTAVTEYSKKTPEQKAAVKPSAIIKSFDREMRIIFKRRCQALLMTKTCFEDGDALLLREVWKFFVSHDAAVEKTLVGLKGEMDTFFNIFRGDRVGKFKKCERGNATNQEPNMSTVYMKAGEPQDPKPNPAFNVKRSGILTQIKEDKAKDFAAAIDVDPENGSTPDLSPLVAVWPMQTVPMAFLEKGVCKDEPYAGYFSGTVGEVLVMGEWALGHSVKSFLKVKPAASDAATILNRRCISALGSSFLLDIGYHTAIEVRPSIKRYQDGAFQGEITNFDTLLFNATQNDYYINYKETDATKLKTNKDNSRQKINARCDLPWLNLSNATDEICKLYYNTPEAATAECGWQTKQYKERDARSQDWETTFKNPA